jgi:hypothetical protein
VDYKPKDFTDAELSDIAEADYKSLIDTHIHRATDGTVASAKAILTEFCACVENQTSDNGERFLGNGSYEIDPRIVRYLAKCFRHYLDDVKIERAMNVESENHRPDDPDKNKRHLEIAKDVARLLQGDEVAKMIDIQVQVAGERGISLTTVKNAYRDHKEIAEAVVIMERKWLSMGKLS